MPQQKAREKAREKASEKAGEKEGIEKLDDRESVSPPMGH